ncbi:MAG: NADH:ubiquinone oxidoreductase subunit H [Alphaproteobacteria bacterium ADurb.Bin438]|nr:MAG: NADH:ubiquinone oxidoreductase subunit H [Alphaproteobacteria bacterium ADurb.Bin438]
MKNYSLYFTNFIKDLTKSILKTNCVKGANKTLPFIVLFINILPFLFIPIASKSIIESNFSSLYLLILLPLTSIIIFFDSLMSKSNILCVYALKYGMQAIIFYLILFFTIISIGMNYHSLDLSIISLSHNSFSNFLLELPIMFLFFGFLVVYDNNLISEYAKQYSGVYYIVMKISSYTSPLKEVLLFVILFLNKSENPFNPAETHFMFFALKVLLSYITLSILKFNVPRLRADQIIDLFSSKILFISIIWIALKSIILFN